MKKYIRSERANLFEPNVYISMIVKLSGNLQSEEIEQAVYKAYEANETTMSKIVWKRMEMPIMKKWGAVVVDLL